MRRALPLLVCAALASACSEGGNETTLEITGTSPASPSETTSAPTEPTEPTPPPGTGDGGPPKVVETIATGLEAPWGLDFFEDGDAIVTERDSKRVLRIEAEGGHAVTELGTIDSAAPFEEAGLLGVALSPEFETDRTAFFYVSTAQDNRVVRAEIDGNSLGEPKPILTGIPVGAIHDGGRLEFGPDGYLYVSTGETGTPTLAQDRDSLAGKVLRITPDGDPAPGNPFNSEIWSWGHRNIQGLAFDDDDRLWASEFGFNTFDELNLIEAGDNYGWPHVEGKGGEPEYVDPQLTWSTDEASPSGLAYADGHLWMAALRGERLWRVEVGDNRAKNPEGFFVGDYGRMRTIGVTPDGRLWVMTSNRDGRGDPTREDDRILLVEP
jgi:glucose/arabinose dehydrogenase